MKKICTLLFSSLGFFAIAQAPSIQWQKCYGGHDDDKALTICNGTDGGYIIAGITKSVEGDVTVSYNDPTLVGVADIWITKLDDFGNLQWQKSIGGSLNESTYSIIPVNDGGYLIAAFTTSPDYDVTHLNSEYSDAWLVKIDQSGNIQWQKTYGGSGIDGALCVQQTSDGGYILGGMTHSNDIDVSGHHGDSDFWVVKLNHSGNIEWQKALGGSGKDSSNAIIQTHDGGYAICGNTTSSDGDISGQHGLEDAWIVKLDATGSILWQRTMGGSRYDQAHDIQQTADNGLIICGFTSSADGDLNESHLSTDYWIIKLNADGQTLWHKTYGGSAYDTAQNIRVTDDGGFILNGSTQSTDGDVVGKHGADNFDYWAVRLDSEGTLLWQKPLGGSDYDLGFGVLQAPDGGFVFSGGTSSLNGDVTGLHNWFGTLDFWIAKLEPELSTDGFNAAVLAIFPNPATSLLHIQLPTGMQAEKINITDSSGKSILQTQVSPIPVESLAAGIYFVEVASSDKIFRTKFIKQ